jgi:hypothetical protein
VYKQRQYARSEIKGIVSFAVAGDAARVIKADLNEFSFGGFSVSAEARLEVGAIVQFDILPEILGEHIKGRAVVRHAREFQKQGRVFYIVGFEFIEINKQAVISLMNISRAKANQEKTGASKPRSKYDGPF